MFTGLFFGLTFSLEWDNCPRRPSVGTLKADDTPHTIGENNKHQSPVRKLSSPTHFCLSAFSSVLALAVYIYPSLRRTILQTFKIFDITIVFKIFDMHGLKSLTYSVQNLRA